MRLILINGKTRFWGYLRVQISYRFKKKFIRKLSVRRTSFTIGPRRCGDVFGAPPHPQVLISPDCKFCNEVAGAFSRGGFDPKNRVWQPHGEWKKRNTKQTQSKINHTPIAIAYPHQIVSVMLQQAIYYWLLTVGIFQFGTVGSSYTSIIPL